MSVHENSNSIINPDNFEELAALRHARELVHNNPATKYCVLDTSGDGDTLLVFCATKSQIQPIKQLLKDVWKREIEIICATDYAGSTYVEEPLAASVTKP